jgi:hypothetical protein
LTLRFGRLYLTGAILLVLFATSCVAPGPEHTLRVSKLSDRSFSKNLQGQVVAGNIYAFLSPPAGVSRVQFFVDNRLGLGAPTSTENDPPFDLLGGTGYAARPLDTRRLSEGEHTLTARLTLASGETDTISASFTIRNTTPSNRAIYWGTAIAGVPWDMGVLSAWGSAAGKQPSIVHFWQPWSVQGAFSPFQPALLESIRNHGSIPMITWLPEMAGRGVSQPDYQLSAITAGKYDAYLSDWARDARDWGHPFFLRWSHEMNGFWFPWGEDVNGNKRGEYVLAWRHIVDIFRAAGAKNVTWVWCPNIDWAGSGWPTMQSLYPGANYVDWTCLDGYNWGPDKGAWKTFDEIFRWSYENIRSVAPDKPVMIGEFGASEKGGSKAAWIIDTFTNEIPYDYPGLKAVVWYNYLMDQDWRVESSQASAAAFKQSIASPYYSPGIYGGLEAAPIPAIK